MGALCAKWLKAFVQNAEEVQKLLPFCNLCDIIILVSAVYATANADERMT